MTCDRIWHYLAGPMSGLPDHNYPAFEEAASKLRTSYMQASDALRTKGLLVKSPHELKYPGKRGSRPYSEYLRGGFRLLMECDKIILLPGWPKSRGARNELDIALDCDMEAILLTKQGTLVSLETGVLYAWS